MILQHPVVMQGPAVPSTAGFCDTIFVLLVSGYTHGCSSLLCSLDQVESVLQRAMAPRMLP